MISAMRTFINGIDRVDSSIGYTIQNSVPCCKICNYAKHNLTLEEFTLWLDRLVEFRTNLKVLQTQGNE